MDVDRSETRSRTLDSDLPQNSRGELKIKGQANAAKSRWEVEARQVCDPTVFNAQLLSFVFIASHQSTKDDDVSAKQELEKRENELKERALRNKVMRTRKGSGGAGVSSG